jgi:hypothetical protein
MLMWEKQVKGIQSRSRQEILDSWDAGEQSFNMPDEIINIPESTLRYKDPPYFTKFKWKLSC